MRTDKGLRNAISIPEMARKAKSISVIGHDNQIIVEEGAELPSLRLSIRGNGNKISVGRGCVIKGGIFIKGHNCSIIIGEGTTVVGFRITVAESTSLVIGRDCMFSRNIEIRTTDEHPIYDLASSELINPGRDVSIGDHVWIGEGVRVVKGCSIPSGCVIGTLSVATGKLPAANSAYAGSPARLLREGIVWARTYRTISHPSGDGA